MNDAQFGFRKREGCKDAIFALSQLSKKAGEYQKNLNKVFIYHEKAIGLVNRNQPWEILEQYVVRGKFPDNVRATYSKSESAVQNSSGLTD